MLEVVIWDVHHGSAAYVKTPVLKHIAIDLGTGSHGSSSSAFSPLLYLKNNWGVTRLDGVIISHPHRDHLDDIVNFDALSPAMFTRPVHLSDADVRAGNQSSEQAIIDQYLQINARYTNPVDVSNNVFLPANNGGVEITNFHPQNCSTSNLNNHSIVTVLSYKNCKMLFPGDNEPPSWNELLGRPDFKSAIAGTDILVASHHGRDSGYSAALFDHISPYLTIVSDGRVGDTSATSKYSAHSKGWKVSKRSGGSIERKCVTTRNDGVIVVQFGENSPGKPFIEVTIN